MDKGQVAIKRLQAASDMSLSAYDQKLAICIISRAHGGTSAISQCGC